MRKMILFLVLTMLVAQEYEDEIYSINNELPQMVQEMDEEFAKWFKQMEDDMKKFDNEFYEEFNESNFEISTNSCGFSLERNEEYVKLIGESSSLTDITWKISRMYVYPDHPIPEFFFGFLEDLQFQDDQCNVDTDRRRMLLGLDDLINTITNDDMTKDLMDSMSGGNADLGNMLDLMAKNGNDEDYEKELEDLEFLLSFQKDWEKMSEEEFRKLLIAQGKNSGEIEVLIQQFRQQKEDNLQNANKEKNGKNYKVEDGNIIINGNYYNQIQINKMKVKQLDQFLRNYELHSSYMDQVQELINQNLSGNEEQDFSFLPKGYGYILNIRFKHEGQTCGLSTHYQNSFNQVKTVSQLPDFKVKIKEHEKICLQPGEQYTIELLDSIEENVYEQQIEIGPYYVFGTDNNCILGKARIIQDPIYDGTYQFKLPENIEKNQNIYIKYTKLTDTNHYIGLAILQMDKTLHNESDIVEKILALSITDLEDVYMLIQLIQSYQSETVELSEDYDNKNINLIHKYCQSLLMISYSNPIPTYNCIPDNDCNKEKGKCTKEQFKNSQIFVCKCNENNKDRNGNFCEMKLTTYDAIQTQIIKLLEADIGNSDQKIDYIFKLFGYGLFEQASIEPLLTIIKDSVQDIYFFNTYKTLFSLLSSIIQMHPDEFSEEIYKIFDEAIIKFASTQYQDTELKTDNIIIKVLTSTSSKTIELGGFLYGNSINNDIYIGYVQLPTDLSVSFSKMVLAISDCKISNCLVSTAVYFKLLDDNNKEVSVTGNMIYSIPLVQKNFSLDELMMEQVIGDKRNACVISEIQYGSLKGSCSQLHDVTISGRLICLIIFEVNQNNLFAGLPEIDLTQDFLFEDYGDESKLISISLLLLILCCLFSQ